ncbi:FAD binding domain-containing protein [Streptomyces chiangmaiensis]
MDLRRLTGLRKVRQDGSGLRIGALTTHHDLETPQGPAAHPDWAVLAQTARLVGHLPIRTRGTVGGSLAHGDPVAEWCLLAVLLDAEITATGPDGSRTITADRFFTGATNGPRTALRWDEIITEVLFPAPAPTSALVEFSPQDKELPLVAAAAEVRLAADGTVAAVRLALAGAADRPVRARAAERALVGRPADTALPEAAASLVVRSLTPPDDARASSGYRRELATVLTTRALRASLRKADPR